MNLLSSQLERFAALCRDGSAAATRRGRAVLVSWSFEVPDVTVAQRVRRLPADSDRTFVWASSWSGQRRLAVDTALDVAAHGAGRFEHVATSWAQCRDGALVEGIGWQPSLVGGFRFSPQSGGRRGVLPDALMWLPAAQLTEVPSALPVLTLNAWVKSASSCDVAIARAEKAAHAIMSGAVDRETTCARLKSLSEAPSPLEWKALLCQLLDTIAAGSCDKVVLARQVVAGFDRPIAVAPILSSLIDQHDVGAVFGARLGQHWFLGSTPECLLHLHNDRVDSHGLAGSARRDRDPARDAQLAHHLQTDPKLATEHVIVADFVERTLRRFFRDVRTGTDEPVLKLTDLQHRQTAISAAEPVCSSLDLLRLAGALHPTPAVAGSPRLSALQWLDAYEPFDRGWYGGPIGWAGADGGGELAVAIRSAMIIADTATLYAGCGIVAGADPDEEYAESCIKLQPMRKALGILNHSMAVP